MNKKEIKTKNGDKMAFINASDADGEAEFTIFPSEYRNIDKNLHGKVVFINGKVMKRFSSLQVVINSIKLVWK